MIVPDWIRQLSPIIVVCNPTLEDIIVLSPTIQWSITTTKSSIWQSFHLNESDITALLDKRFTGYCVFFILFIIFIKVNLGLSTRIKTWLFSFSRCTNPSMLFLQIMIPKFETKIDENPTWSFEIQKERSVCSLIERRNICNVFYFVTASCIWGIKDLNHWFNTPLYYIFKCFLGDGCP